MQTENSSKPIIKKSNLDKYHAKSVHIDDTSGQTTAPDHYGSGAVYVAKENKED
ncbi:hypothetical protein SPSYN_02551 [Sporotomaculum syntrophicum]|uniref:Uncharacterized protein n=1 Tax=Sporotomaculum syntrophicum TaxID=182264 RepID=A0A9D3AWR4_9FIRM|nr:hypothetical protein [Sporotomaculum syntrophicum]KAF1084147.1 hypothetical protein SPSYN_02551 [Sporotomaculum syntrophicum]